MKIEVRKITTADCKEWARTDRKTVSPTRYNNTVFGASVLFENIHARDNTSIGNRPLFFNGITLEIGTRPLALGRESLTLMASAGDAIVLDQHTAFFPNSTPLTDLNQAEGFPLGSSPLPDPRLS